MSSLPAPTLEAHGLQSIRSDRLLFENLAFTLGAGEALLVEGPNGSGKTTLLRMLCGLGRPTEGTVLWCGTDIRAAWLEYVANLSYIGHRPSIKEDLTPLENLRVACALDGAREGMEILAVLDRVGLFGFEDVPCRTLSAGQRRRVALARLLLLDTPLWILDEPLTAIDRHGVAMLEQTLDDHLQAGGMAVLTTHQRIGREIGNMKRLIIEPVA